MVRFDNVTFSYSRKNKLLNNISLHLHENRIHGLLGKNGEGKSTLLKLISGLDFPHSGGIATMGFDPRKRKPQMLQEIFFLTEELPESLLSIAQYEKIYAPFYPNFDHEQFDQFLSEFEVENKQIRISKLSYGQRKKIYIAFGFATNTRLILMDEPTNGLDIPSKGQFRKIMASIFDENRCIVISTHQVLDLNNLIDNIIIMDKHKIVFDQTIESISQKLYFNYGLADEIKSDATIYCEDCIRGKNIIIRNELGMDSKVDIELLFNAVLSEGEKIKDLFNNQQK